MIETCYYWSVNILNLPGFIITLERGRSATCSRGSITSPTAKLCEEIKIEFMIGQKRQLQSGKHTMIHPACSLSFCR